MAYKNIKDIDINMKELISDNSLESKWINIDSDIINNYMQGKGLKNGTFNRLNDEFISDNLETLKYHPAGENLIFKTNSNFIKIKASLVGNAYMSHMTAVGTIGFSLYVYQDNTWRFISSTKVNSKEYEVDLLKDITSAHIYRLYFPLYQVLENVSIGLNMNSEFEFINLNEDSLLIYGTSISQGGCATRPGMDYGSILGRLCNLNVINLGFSGSCKLEPKILDIINEFVDVRNIKYIIFELEANSPSYEHLETRFSYFLENLKNKENIKIYLISHFDEGITYINDEIKKYRQVFKKLQRKMCNKYDITFIDGEKIIKNLNCDGTVDGVHLTDLGFYELACKLEKIIKK